MRRLMTTLLLIALLFVQLAPATAQDDTRWISHIVQPEDNLFRIALQYGLTVEVIMRANGLTDANLVVAGQQLLIPLGASAAVPAPAAPRTPVQTTVLGGAVMHTVAASDTIAAIAARYGITADALRAANSLGVSSALTPGQLLVIPVQSPADLGLIGVAPVAPSPRPVIGAEMGFTQPDLGLIGVEIVVPPAPAEDIDTSAVLAPESAINSAPAADPEADAETQEASTAALAEEPAISDEDTDESAEPDAVASAVAVAVAEDTVGTPAETVAEAVELDTDDALEASAESSMAEDVETPVEAAADAVSDTAPADTTTADAAPESAYVVDLGILPVDPANQPAFVDTVPDNSSASAEASAPANPPDLGILAPEAAWLSQSSIVSLGGGDLRAIYIRGLALGNNPHAFAKIGDCNSETPWFLTRFDQGEYDLGPYRHLQSTVDHFAGSFARESVAAWTGNHVWALLDPTWANPAYCLPGETPLECEFRITKPSIALIRLGTNESRSPQLFEDHMRRVITFTLERGTIPVLGTKADRLEGSDAINEIIRGLAAEYRIPLWDFGRAADHIPGRGLSTDGFHLTYFPPDYTQPFAVQSGHGLHNLTALMALDAVLERAMY